MAKHSVKYHLKQLDKIAKTGIVPDVYKKIFRGMKKPQAHIKKIDSDLVKIDKKIHDEHIKTGLKYDKLCYVCKPDGTTKRKKKE